MATHIGRPRLIELLGSLSLATDLATGQPLGHAIRTCLIAVDLARELGCDSRQIRHVQQTAMLRFLGCTAEASESAREVGGDEISFNRAMGSVLNGGPGEIVREVAKATGPGQPAWKRAGMIARGVFDTDTTRQTLGSHCEVAAMLAHRLGLEPPVGEALHHAYERWDGKGFPDGLDQEAIPLEMRIAVVARDIDLLHQSGGDPVDVLGRRRGKAYDPGVVDAALRITLHRLPEADWDMLLDTEPYPGQRVEGLSETLEVMADFTDLKSPWTRAHSRNVADLAASAGALAGMGDDEVEMLRFAGLAHDVGRVGVAGGIWDKPGSLSTDEWEKVRLHPYLTERILSRCEALRPVAAIAARHHERNDGTGYHARLDASQLSPAALILGAADVCVALTSDRPHRPAYTPDEAEDLMTDEVERGRLDRWAAEHVMAASRGEATPPAFHNPGGLTDREVEVLRLISRERTNREIARELFISPKTVGRHVENIYGKIGVSTRAGAAVFAMANGLIRP